MYAFIPAYRFSFVRPPTLPRAAQSARRSHLACNPPPLGSPACVVPDEERSGRWAVRFLTRCWAHACTDATFGRVLLEAKEFNIRKVRVLEQALQRIGADAWNVVLLQQIEPLVGGALLQFLAEHLVERIDIRRAGGDVGETRVGLHNMRLAGGLEKAAPLAIVVGEYGDEAVPGLIRATMLRQRARIAGCASGRIEVAPCMCSASTNCAMVSNIGTSIRWPMPVTPCQQSGEHRIGRRRTDDAVDRCHRDEARLAGEALQQHRNTRGRLDQVIVGRAPGVTPPAAVANHAEIDDGRIELLHRLIVKPKTGKCARTDVRGERIDRRHQTKQRLTGGRLLEVHDYAALAARVERMCRSYRDGAAHLIDQFSHYLVAPLKWATPGK